VGDVGKVRCRYAKMSGANQAQLRRTPRLSSRRNDFRSASFNPDRAGEGLQMKNSRIRVLLIGAAGRMGKPSMLWRMAIRTSTSPAVRPWRFDRTADEKLRCGYRF
jgi:hypothetical protein